MASPAGVDVPPPPAFVAAPIPIRDVMPTLAGEEPVRSPTLRPTGATPPPPRSFPQARVPSFDLDVEVDEPPQVEAGHAATPAEGAVSPGPAPVDVATAAPSAPEDSPPPPPAVVRAPESPPTPEATPAAGPAMASPNVSVAEPPRPRRTGVPGRANGPSRQAITIATSASLLLPAAAIFIAALMKAPSSDAESRTPVSTAPPASAPSAPSAPSAAAPSAAAQDDAPGGGEPAPRGGCSVANAASRLAGEVFAAVPALVAGEPGGPRAAVGFAIARDRAAGVLVDLESLAVTPELDRQLPGATLLGVVPGFLGGKATFSTDVASASFASMRTVGASPPYAIGVTPTGLKRARARTLTMLWPGSAPDPTITTPRVAAVPGGGHAVAFRHGGAAGKVLVGWLDAGGERRTDLVAVATDASFVGTPAVGAGEEALLVAFAAKNAEDAPYRVELATAAHGGVPSRARPFELPPGGPGGEAIAPAAEGLPGGSFLLQWTEGGAGNRQVRVQVLSADLTPLGEPVALSTAEQNAGQGTLWADGQRALSLFLVKGAASHELWGASLKCP